MKRALFLAAVLSVLASCDVDRKMSGSYWGEYDYRSQYYESYPEDIMSECVKKPVLALDYVQRLRETVGKNLESGVYVVSDTCGNKVGPIECQVAGKDTTWLLDSGKYAVSHDGPDSWKVTADFEDEYSSFRYKFELTARQTSEVRKNIVHRPWHVELAGQRKEKNPDYWLEFRSDGMESSSLSPGSFKEDIHLDGKIRLLFYRFEKERDWMDVTYSGESIRYEMSF